MLRRSSIKYCKEVGWIGSLEMTLDEDKGCEENKEWEAYGRPYLTDFIVVTSG